MLGKLKRGTRHTYNGRDCWIELHKNNREVLVCFSEGRDLSDEYETVRPSNLKPFKAIRKPIQQSKQTPKVNTSLLKPNTGDLNAFFISIESVMPFGCQCCGKPLYAFTRKAKRSVSAHILPKNKFKSVKMHPMNILFMGADYIGCPCNCHDRWDMNLSIRKSMPVYKLALERFETLKEHLTDGELISAYKYLGIEYANDII